MRIIYLLFRSVALMIRARSVRLRDRLVFSRLPRGIKVIAIPQLRAAAVRWVRRAPSMHYWFFVRLQGSFCSWDLGEIGFRFLPVLLSYFSLSSADSTTSFTTSSAARRRSWGCGGTSLVPRQFEFVGWGFSSRRARDFDPLFVWVAAVERSSSFVCCCASPASISFIFSPFFQVRAWGFWFQTPAVYICSSARVFHSNAMRVDFRCLDAGSVFSPPQFE
jgi:hypothetical protein